MAELWLGAIAGGGGAVGSGVTSHGTMLASATCDEKKMAPTAAAGAHGSAHLLTRLEVQDCRVARGVARGIASDPDAAAQLLVLPALDLAKLDFLLLRDRLEEGVLFDFFVQFGARAALFAVIQEHDDRIAGSVPARATHTRAPMSQDVTRAAEGDRMPPWGRLVRC